LLFVFFALDLFCFLFCFFFYLKILQQALREKPPLEAFREAYFRTNEIVMQKLPEKDSSGSTAINALIRGDMLYTANVGDARTVLCRNGKAVRLSVDHKTNVAAEVTRVQKSGGFIINGRVGGALMISRAFGDRDFKDLGIIVEPYLLATQLEHTDSYLILACDGVSETLQTLLLI
jgi:serine/threonine protein phosphatase PrpC